MQFCQTHWNSLRESIEQKGLGSLISDTGEQATRAIQSTIQDGTNVDNFDPLMNAMWAIIQNAGDVCGNLLVIMSDNDDGTPRCPICYINAENPWGANYDWWIEAASTEQVNTWKEFKA